jgi:hypothetical protein
MESKESPASPARDGWAKSQFRFARYLYLGLVCVELFWALLTLLVMVYFPGEKNVNFKISMAILLLLFALMFAATFLLARCPVCNVLAPLPNRKTCRKCGTELA